MVVDISDFGNVSAGRHYKCSSESVGALGGCTFRSEAAELWYLACFQPCRAAGEVSVACDELEEAQVVPGVSGLGRI